MKYYEFSKFDRIKIKKSIYENIFNDLNHGLFNNLLKYSTDPDTYMRKNAYLCIGKIYIENPELRNKILEFLTNNIDSPDEKVRQTVVYSLAGIGSADFNSITGLLIKSMSDPHHSVRNAVIGVLKQLCLKNPVQTIEYSKKYLHHDDYKIRREIIHGLELRGRTHPDEILPLLYEVQNDDHKLIKKMIIHVLGQISYKKGCLEKVISHLKIWPDKELVRRALEEIIKVHYNYHKFSYYPPGYVEDYIKKELGDVKPASLTPA